MHKFWAILWIILSLKCSGDVYIIKTTHTRSAYFCHSSFDSLCMVVTSKLTVFLIEKGIIKFLAFIVPWGDLEKVLRITRGEEGL